MNPAIAAIASSSGTPAARTAPSAASALETLWTPGTASRTRRETPFATRSNAIANGAGARLVARRSALWSIAKVTSRAGSSDRAKPAASASPTLRIVVSAFFANAPNNARSSSSDLWSRLTLLSTAIFGWYKAIDPSLSSTSLTNASPSPTSALANGASGRAKFFITAPFITVGSRPQACRIQPIMPVTVDFPLVPATPIGSVLALNSDASSSGRLSRSAPTRSAATISATLASTAADATTICSAEVTPDPSCGNSVTPFAARSSNFAGSRPASRVRSEPATRAPRPARIIASGIIPLPPIPTKK